jgi:hypothetical protein
MKRLLPQNKLCGKRAGEIKDGKERKMEPRVGI